MTSSIGNSKSPIPEIESEDSNQEDQMDDFAIEEYSVSIDSESSQSILSD